MKFRLLFLGLFAVSFNVFSQQRIVTAGSAITETVCALGDCALIVASDRTSLFPTQIQSLPSIGYRSGISAEGIIAQRPTIVIAEKDYVEDGVLAQVASAGVTLMVIERDYSIEGTSSMILKIAEALSRQDEAEKVITAIKSELQKVNEVVKLVKNKPRVLCVYNRGTSTVSVAGRATFSDILPYVGAKDAVTGVEGYKPLNTEALIASNPDYILFLQSGLESIGGVEGALSIPGIAQTQAGIKRQIIAMESIKLTNFGPRLGEAVSELALLLYPELMNGQ
jgi:iron complex transport system substrate-binding protein